MKSPGREPRTYQPTDLLRIQEVAVYLQTSLRTVERMPLPWTWISKGQRRILFSTLIEWIKAGGKAA